MKPESFPARPRTVGRRPRRPFRKPMSHAAIDRAYRSVWWSIIAAPNWSVDRDEHCVSFTKPDGVGALQISAYKHDSGEVPDNLSELLAGHFPEGLTLEPVTCGGFSGIGVDYVA